MVNSEEFAQRLQHIMDHYHLNGSAFAESIGVQRSAISHILSGRNKPSLEFVLKILDTYPDVELYWLLNGKGPGPFRQEQPAEKDLFSNIPQPAYSAEVEPKAEGIPDLPFITGKDHSRKIRKIVIFYSDNTFEEILNS